MLLIIQEIKVKWTKQSRGAPHSTRRNAVPSILALPPIDTLALDAHISTIFHHQTVFNEIDDFAPYQTVVTKRVEPANRIFRFGCVRLQFTKSSVEVIFTYTYYCGGAPDRSAPAKAIFTLHPNEWGQIIYNGRFSRGYSGDWYYQQFTFNIAVSTTLPADNYAIFANATPVKVYKNLVDLR